MEQEQMMEDEEAAIEVASSDNGKPNIMQALRERRAEIGEDRQTYIDVPGLSVDIPGFGSVGLIGQYRKMGYDEIEKIADRVQRSKHPRKTLMAQVDTIVEALVQMCVRMPDRSIVPVAELTALPDEPVRYDNRLGDFLGFSAEGSARRAVLATFNNDLAIPSHHVELSVWMQTSLKDEEEDFSENS